MATAQPLHTADDLWEYSQQFPDKTFELWEGIITEVAPTGGESSYIASELGRWIGTFVYDNKLGHVVGADGVLDGSDILPGFKLAVRDIFQVLEDQEN